MSKIKANHGDWVVVCDGRKALILVNAGDEVFPNLQTTEIRDHTDAPTSQLGTDRPGRVYSSFSKARSGVEQTDWHDEAERSFLHSLAKRLDHAIGGNETKSIILVAPPRALGMLREAFSAPSRRAIRHEVAHDFVKLSTGEIEKRLFS